MPKEFLAQIGKSAGFVTFALFALFAIAGLLAIDKLEGSTFAQCFSSLVYATMGGGAVAGLRKLVPGLAPKQAKVRRRKLS